MGASEGGMTIGRCPSPPPPAVLEIDDLVSEILLRLPPEPSSLPRASLVCKRWRGLVSDPRFLRRFRLHHHRNPPLLGYFKKDSHQILFVPTMEAPNRVPDGPFSSQLDDGDKAFLLLGCRHGLVLIYHASMNRLLVWDPVTADQHGISLPQGFDWPPTPIHAAVVRSAAEAQHFQVIMVGTVPQKQHAPARASARVYSSETGKWGNLISIRLPPQVAGSMTQEPAEVHTLFPSVLVGDSIYWLLSESFLLEFDLDRQRLALIPVPVDMNANGNCHFSVMRADDGGLGCFFLSKLSAQVWKRKTGPDGVASWVLGRTIQMDELLPLRSSTLIIVGFAEVNNVVFLWTFIGLFMVQLESLQFKTLPQTNITCCYIPFERVYAAGTSVGGGHDGAELLHNN